MKISYILIALGGVITAVLVSLLMPKSLPSESEVATSDTQKIPSKIHNSKTIFALGDSLTAGYQLPLEQSYPMQLERLLVDEGYDYGIINGGKSGDTSAGLLARVSRVTQDAKPGDIALLVIGANDGMQSLQLDQLEDNIQKIITLLQDKEIIVILGGMQLPTNLDPVYRDKFTTLYRTIATSKQLPYINFFLEGVAAIPELNLKDGIHPNKQGYAIIARNIYTFLKENKLITK